jgi:predicted nucleic acid-binding protein
MNRAFADTLYWVAVTNPRDPWRQPALEARRRLGATWIITIDEVLTEFLTAMAGQGAFLRRKAVEVVRSILTDEGVIVVPQTRFSFLAGLALYEARGDKAYSLTDCIAMHTMREEGIADVLTHDEHFRQEGFNTLIQR